ncbi:hypothetical protein [Neochlamydia sp. AcF95]|nr:hypothetical protein [Neochlamydia sp. AcF95]MBS4169552.1 hypothetical protein [Neochlamydia sp. AcF95]
MQEKQEKHVGKNFCLSLPRGRDRANRFYAGDIGTAEQAGQ